jgi:glutathione-regulated potassium-efflux system protein KefB
MAVEGGGGYDLAQVVALLGAGVIAVPIFKRLGLGPVLGYFTAGLIVGPFGLALFEDPERILHFAEFGVIMLLFIIGLEMEPARLWALRRQIFGLGLAQVALCGTLLTLAGTFAGLPLPVAFVAGLGFVLSSTAVVMQMLEERGETATPAGQRAVSILLLEDLAIVPLLAIVAFIGPRTSEGGTPLWQEMGIAFAALAVLVLAGRYLLNPMFAVLARAKAREVMTAAALLVVLGASLLMDEGGLSMAMGAFLAGVFLSESTFKNQLEADIEPFRGILLGLFFLAVGMSLDLSVIAQEWMTIAVAVVGFILVKSIGIYVVARLLGSSRRESIVRVSLFAQGGEFAFVLYSAAVANGIFDGQTNAIFTATVIISMALTPITAIVMRHVMPDEPISFEGIDKADGLQGRVLMIGFGRFSQAASQSILARGIEISIIESDVDMIRAATDFGFKVYFGEGTRLDTLRASGAGTAEAVLVCVDDPAAATRIVELLKAEFPHTAVFARAHDRGHALDLVKAGADYQIRETLESAFVFGAEVLRRFDTDEETIADIVEDVRRRDAERFDLQLAGGFYAGRDLMRGNAPVPAPLVKPRKPGVLVDEEGNESAVPAAS